MSKSWILGFMAAWIFFRTNAQLLNQLPHFVPSSGDMARFSLLENTPVGSPVYQLRGIDPESSRLTYSISGPIFSVDRETGVVRLRQELDRETQDTIEVIISITDEGVFGTEPNTVSLRREVPVRDYNDNQPIFIGRPYTSNVRESLAGGQQLEVIPKIIVVDRDQGINSQLKIKCFQESEICETFEVRAERLSEGNYTANIVLKKPLDFESRPSYIMTLMAADGAIENRLTSFASISINVIDVQDQPPIFTNAPYSATLEENTIAGISVLTIKAIDGDAGKPRDIFLSLEDEPFGHFELEQVGNLKDGTAILKTTNIPLDRENSEILQNGGVYVFNVRATELIDGQIPADFSITSITVVVTDVDDHIPEFNAKVFNISIPESLEKGMALPGLSVFVDDRDMAENSRYTISLRDIKHSSDNFAVSPTEAQGRTPVVIQILNSSVLDYDVYNKLNREFIFDIVASVNDVEKASARVQVHLLDANDNAPIFEKNIYRFKAEENITVGMQIGRVNATDKDSGKFGKITYLLRGFGSDNFFIDPDSGGFFVHKTLDYEKQNGYSLSIVAVDGGSLETNANVIVEVIDVNDNYPIFENKEYTRTIREGTSNFEPQFFVRAEDWDGPTQGGGKLKYAIVSENSISGNVFRIDEGNGEITLQKVAKSMDTERGEYELVISATDFGVPPLTNNTHVYIRVGISGNQRPIFKGHFQNIENVPVLGPPSYRVSIPENAEANYNVTTVTAHDPDGLDSLLRYRIVGANDNFEIDEVTGLITVSPQARIDRDSNMDSFEITVNAVDSGLPIPETATTTIYVNIKDINDENPKFEQASYAGYVSERTAVGETVLKVRAIDKDLNSKLEYTIENLVQAMTKAGVSIANRSNYNAQAAFRIDKETGEIFVNSTLRHDVAAVMVFTVQVRDLNAEINRDGQKDTTEVTIYVQSFKDTNPVFKNAGWTSSRPVVKISIKEEMPIDSVLFILQVDDPITKQPISNFELLEPKNLEYFHLHERTGEVILKKRLDYETLQSGGTQIEFQVKAISHDGQRNTISRVNVTVHNVNDNSPKFEETTYHASLVENKEHPEKVINVKANDKDAVLTARDEQLGYHKIRYSLQGENAALFEINNMTGEIFVATNKTIDREVTPHIRLQIKAEDSPGRPMDTKQSLAELLIDVLDVNDNAPVFEQKNYTAVVPENAPIDVLVLRVHANDLDDGLGGEVRYQLINEGELNGLFKINALTGEVRSKRVLTGKGRSEPYEFGVWAQDNGSQLPKQESLASEVKIQLFIGDVSANDGIPYFNSPKIGERANVTENAPVGTVVFHVKASDPDNPNSPSGILSYRIQDTPDAHTFDIDASTGRITTRKFLDREQKDMYNIILEVMDNGEPRNSVTRILQIRVLDLDDHMPQFQREVDEGPLEFSALEEEPAGTIVGNFSAIDEDIGENAAIDYVIIDGNAENVFKVERNNDSMAILRTTRPINREEVDSYELIIKCLPLGKLSYKYLGDAYDNHDLSHIKLLIHIKDIDDNLPKFTQKASSIGIRTNVPIDTVITSVHATDADAEAKPITMSIENVTFVPQFYKRKRTLNTGNLHKLFTLINQTGELRTGGSFADYVDGFFEMRILANNSLISKRHAFQQLKIFVIRDKSLLKFVFARSPSEIQNFMRSFQHSLQQQLQPLGLELHILDTQVMTRADNTLDFSATSSCFQMFKDGVAMPLKEMQELMHSEDMRQLLLETYAEYSVSEVDMCSMPKSTAAAILMASSGAWLVLLAALIALATLVVTCTACCLKRKYKRKTKRSLQASRASTEQYNIGTTNGSVAVGVPVFYSEPIYGPL